MRHSVRAVGFALLLSACSGGGGNEPVTVPALPPAPPPPPAPTNVCPDVPGSAPAGWADALDFTGSLPLRENVDGAAGGEVSFLQSIKVFPKRRANERRPHLTMHRSALLLYRPEANDVESVTARIRRGDGDVLSLDLAHPFDIPDTDQVVVEGRPQVRYSKCSWTARVPWDFIEPGMSLELDADGRTGEIPAAGFTVDAPHELIAHNLEIGMLVRPEANSFRHLWTADAPDMRDVLAPDYFQKLPISRFTVAEYEPVYFPEVVLQDGTRYTDKSADTTADVFRGDMRELVANRLVGTAINNANVGSIVSAGSSEQAPRPERHTTIYTAVGRYTDPVTGDGIIVSHGRTGGVGKLTLQDTARNEYTHEYGHDFELVHYPDGIEAIHSVEGGWGFDLANNVFIGALKWEAIAMVTSLPVGVSRAPFQDAYAFNTDPMASGEPNGNTSLFTLHTANSARLIQDHLFSRSGRYNQAARRYEIWDRGLSRWVARNESHPRPEERGVPVMTVVGLYDPDGELPAFIYPALYGNYGNVFSANEILMTSPDLNQTCRIRFAAADGSRETFPLADTRFDPDVSNKFHINLAQAASIQRAELYCRAPDGTDQLLASRDFDPPQGQLRPPLTLGPE